MKQQIVVIRGGDTFKTYKEYISCLKRKKLNLNRLKSRGWKNNLSDDLGRNFEVIHLRMPNTANARYTEWKIIFNKLMPLLENNVILLGHCLGGVFLIKYLSENKSPKKIKALFLISVPFDEKDSQYTLGDFKLPQNLDKFRKQVSKIFLYHSKDDDVIPFVNIEKYRKILPEAKISIFRNRGHFYQAKFKELVKDIKSLR
jgi:uncharacterized protein